MRSLTMKLFAILAFIFCAQQSMAQYTIDGRYPQNIGYTNNNVNPGSHWGGWDKGWQPGPGAHEIYYQQKAAWENSATYPNRYTNGGFGNGAMYDTNAHYSFGDFASRSQAHAYAARRFATDPNLSFQERQSMMHEMYPSNPSYYPSHAPSYGRMHGRFGRRGR